jgi:uncharacterized protein (DUF1501 family)
MREAMEEITAKRYGNAYGEEFAKAFKEAVKSTEGLGRALSGVKLETKGSWTSNSGADRQLKQISKLIAVREARKSHRDFFFTSIGGWDMHGNMKQGLNNQFLAMDTAFRSFVAEMKAQGVWDNVVMVTSSEFARTLDMNAQSGSDHAWGGQHIMFGGSVNGGKIYNTYPKSMKIGSYLDLGRGRLIPEYPWESMIHPIAKWVGIADADLPTVFPNLAKFNTTHLNSEASVFKAAA